MEGNLNQQNSVEAINNEYHFKSLLKALDSCGSVFRAYLILSELKELLSKSPSIVTEFSHDLINTMLNINSNLVFDIDPLKNFADKTTFPKVNKLTNQILVTSIDQVKVINNEFIKVLLLQPKLHEEATLGTANLIVSTKIVTPYLLTQYMRDNNLLGAEIAENYMFSKFRTDPNYETESLICLDVILYLKGPEYTLTLINLIFEKYRPQTKFEGLHSFKTKVEHETKLALAA